MLLSVITKIRKNDASQNLFVDNFIFLMSNNHSALSIDFEHFGIRFTTYFLLIILQRFQGLATQQKLNLWQLSFY